MNNPGPCDGSRPAPPGAKPALALPVVQPAPPRIAKSRAGKWRATVLIAVHVAIIAHIVQWLVSGMSTGVRRTLSPVEPSETMATLEAGGINAGFVMFVAAILATLLFGRFFCGWLCHIIALQDLCGWIMKKCGIHPKPWRSRLLLWVPPILACYMFIWPTLRREVLIPVARRIWGESPGWLGEAMPMRGFVTRFMVEDFWATFAPWYLVPPFLFVCGFAIVYFLGSKSFCSYGCPYGGFFGPVDRLAPMRIRVTDACHHCGHCTAVCTSNVRVHEEVRDYGAVVDPGCMKCLDCVSVCPNDALYLGLGGPAIATKPRVPEPVVRESNLKRQHRYDLTLREEAVIGLVFFGLFYGYRGMYGSVPLLMAIGIAAIVSFMAQRTARLLTDRNVRGPYWQLKKNGRVTGAGVAFAVVSACLLLIGAQGAVMNFANWRAELIYNQLDIPREAVFAPGYTPSAEVKRRAQEGVKLYTVSTSFRDGGIGFFTDWGSNIRLSWLRAVAGDRAGSEAALRAAIRQREPRDDLILGLGQIIRLRCATLAEVEAEYRSALQQWPGLALVRAALAEMLLADGRLDAAIELHRQGVAAVPADIETVSGAAEFLLKVGAPKDAIALLEDGLVHRPKSPDLRIVLARARLAAGSPGEALEALDQAIATLPSTQALILRADILASQRKFDEAEAAVRRSLVEFPPETGAAIRLSRLMTARGVEAPRIAADLVKLSRTHPQLETLRQSIAGELLNLRRSEDAEMLFDGVEKAGNSTAVSSLTRRDAAELNLALGKPDKALAILNQAAAALPGDAEVIADRARALFLTGQRSEALELFQRARELAPQTDPAARLANQLQNDGKNDDLVAIYTDASVKAPGHLQSAANAAGFWLTQQAFDKVLAVAEAALLAHPCDPTMLDFAARALFLTGKDAEALQNLQKAVDLEPNAERLELLADLLQRSGKSEEAKAVQVRAAAARRAFPRSENR